MRETRFESSVNSEGIETSRWCYTTVIMFESSVNSEGIETKFHDTELNPEFESSVNSEGIETFGGMGGIIPGLRAV